MGCADRHLHTAANYQLSSLTMKSHNSSAIQVGFIGLGAMGMGMASNLAGKSQYKVVGYDIFAPSAQKFAARGEQIAESPRDVAKNSDFLICMPVNEHSVLNCQPNFL